MKKLAVVCIVSLFCFFSLSLNSQALPINGDFSSGVNNWITSGTVTSENEEAIIGDKNGGGSLFQGTALSAGTWVLEFDFSSSLSDEVLDDPFSFTDAFFATLYFSDDLASFDLLSGSPDSLALLDINGSSIVATNGELSASDKGLDWTHFSLTFSNSFAFAIPCFELFDLNYIDGDSRFKLDNVSLTSNSEIPEPATIFLLSSGLLAFGLKRKAKRK